MRKGSATSTRRTRTISSASATSEKASASGSNNIKVGVRVRPFNQTEKDMAGGAPLRSIVGMPSTSEVILETEEDGDKSFRFDRTFWSVNENHPTFASQATLMEEFGNELKRNVLEGFNSCPFAYGQTGSGKTYSVLGSDSDKGLLPRITEALFDEISTPQVRARISTCRSMSSLDRAGANCYIKNVVLFEENSIILPPECLEASGVKFSWGEVSQESPTNRP